jgi:hypothetical protein
MKMNFTNRPDRGRISLLILCSALLTSGLLSPGISCRTAYGAEVKLIPFLEFKEEFSDNVFLNPSDRKSDFITTLTPSVAFSRNSETLNVDLLTGFTWHNYARTEGITSTDYQYSLKVSNRFTPRDDIGLSASYVRSTRPDTIDKTTNLNSGSSDLSQYSATVRRVLDETTTTSLSYSFVQNMYDNPASLGNHVHNASLVVSKDLGSLAPLLKGTVGTNFSRAVYRDSNSDYYTLTVGASRNISENFTLNLSVGGQFIHSTFVTTSETSNNSWGTVGSASIDYKNEKSFGSLSFARNFSPASGKVGAVETTSFGLTLGQGLSDKTVAQINASYGINQASSGQFSSRGSDDRVLNLSADIAYTISKFFDIGLQYTYYNVTYDQSDLQVTRNNVMLRAVAKYPVTR